ncbi:uncharacterized protein H6S33_001863 [Morchella sextelata]|uniref:uncharacterized protein n=1 Tax=Morchella sextelata TaxID=1174677 RepID=UPI001D042A1F|nr:uncharacterized protein H6S33_001863 [Morchella sextelata]KAH0608729.1 hypothetical protein H6S33_001863 [Morchella sextelata]
MQEARPGTVKNVKCPIPEKEKEIKLFIQRRDSEPLETEEEERLRFPPRKTLERERVRDGIFDIEEMQARQFI